MPHQSVDAVLVGEVAVVFAHTNHLDAAALQVHGRIAAHVAEPLDYRRLVLHTQLTYTISLHFLQHK